MERSVLMSVSEYGELYEMLRVRGTVIWNGFIIVADDMIEDKPEFGGYHVMSVRGNSISLFYHNNFATCLRYCHELLDWLNDRC